MIPFPFPLISLASVALVASSPTAAPAPDLELQKLLQRVAARLETPQPPSFIETETEEDLDRHGKTTDLRIYKSSQDRLPDGTPHREVIEAFEGGYLVTGKVRKLKAEWERQTEAAKAKLSVYLELTLPFAAAQQGLYRFTVVGGPSTGPQVLVHFEPAGQRRRLWVGEATLDVATGTILQLFGHPAVLPRFLDYMDVHMEFDPQIASGALPAKEVIEGSGHFLFFRKRMRYKSVITLLPAPARLAGGN